MANKTTLNNFTENICLGRDVNFKYLNDIRKYKVMTAQEESNAFIKYSNSSDAKEKESIRNEILLSNQRFIYSMAKTLNNKGDVVSHLISVGNEGMIEAFEKFDITKGVRFMTYASHYVKRNMVVFLNNNSLITRHCDNTYGTLINKERNEFVSKNMREPSIDELYEIMLEKHGIDVKNLNDFLDISMSFLSDACGDEDMDVESSSEFSERTSADNEYEGKINDEYNADRIERLLRVLDPKSRDIIEMLFGVGEYRGEEITDEEVAEKYGITVTRVSQIKNKAIEKLKSYKHAI